MKNPAVLREVLRSLFSNNLFLCVGKKVKSNSRQHWDATGGTGRATDFGHGIGISTVLGLFANLTAREPLLVANRIQISMASLSCLPPEFSLAIPGASYCQPTAGLQGYQPATLFLKKC